MIPESEPINTIELRDFIVAGRVVRLRQFAPGSDAASARTADIDLSAIVAVVYRDHPCHVAEGSVRGAALNTAADFLMWVVDDDAFQAAWRRECAIRDKGPIYVVNDKPLDGHPFTHLNSIEVPHG